MRFIKVTEASTQQLFDHGQDVLQIDMTGADTRAKVLALLGPALEGDDPEINLPDEPDSGQTGTVTPIPRTLSTGRDDGPPVTLKLMQTEMPGGKHPASPDVNGKMLVIQRNVLVTIPYAYYLVLENAKCGSVAQAPDSPGADGRMRPGDLIAVEVTNYPMSEVRLPPQEEIDAWHERNGKRLLAAA